MQDVKATMGRLEMLVVEIKATLKPTLPHLATKAEVAELRTEMKTDMAGFRAEWKDRYRITARRDGGHEGRPARNSPARPACGAALTALLTACACGLAALAILK